VNAAFAAEALEKARCGVVQMLVAIVGDDAVKYPAMAPT